MTDDTTAPVKVFVSYSWSDPTKEEVGRLVTWLKEREGQEEIEVISDHVFQDNTYPDEGWRTWMEQCIEDADIVLCICGEHYKKAFSKEGGGRGSTWEGAIITNTLYKRFRRNNKFSSVLPEAGAYQVLPSALEEWGIDLILTEREQILRHIKAQYKLQQGGVTQTFQKSPVSRNLQQDTLDKPLSAPSGARADERRNPPAPAFRDLERETLKSKASSSAFSRLRFAERVVDYVELPEVKQALKGFYTSSTAFSWWLIVGGAGSGKSRTALEFCEALKKEGWVAGFLDLEKTSKASPEYWETWRPEQDTLLVIDYVVKEFSSKPEDDTTQIFRKLTLRAKNNDLGDKRLRILLLEREYKEREKRGEIEQPLEWYRQLDKASIYQKPFDLNAISNEGLYRIAQQTAKEIWNSPNPLLPEPVFLGELEKLDKKKRPLFAMLLAGCRAEVNPDTEIKPNDVLDYAIKHELERSLTLMGVEVDPKSIKAGADLFKALILSTCTGGKLGACQLPNGSPLWDSGLGKENDKKRFLFYPIEPDLLGERFVLNCDNSRRNPFHIGREELEELLQRGWRGAPFETAYFFSRCAQDFASTDSEKIADLFLLAIQTVKEDPFNLCQTAWLAALINLTAFLNLGNGKKILQVASELGNTSEVNEARAKASFNLINRYGKAGKLPEARGLFDAMTTLGCTPGIMLERAKASVNLIVWYGNAGNLPEAQVLFDAMTTLSGTPEIMLERAKASVNLINGYGDAGNLPEARALFDAMPTLGDTPEFMFCRAQASVNLIVDYINAGALPEAQVLFDAMTTLGNTLEIMLLRAEVSFNLINGYIVVGTLPEARAIFDAMSIIGNTPEFMLLRAEASINLMNGYGNAGNLPEARALFDAMTTLGNTPKIMLERAKASFNLIVWYGNAGELSEARALFDAMTELGNTLEFMLLRAKASVNLIDRYCNVGKLPEARMLFNAMTTLGSTSEFMLLRAQASIDLINGYGNARNLPEARALFDAMTELGKTPEIMLLRAKASFNLIVWYGSAGELSEARALFDVTDNLSDAPEIKAARAQLADLLDNPE